MYNATINDRKRAISIITIAFLCNPTLLFLIRNEDRKKYYISKIATYAFDFAIRRRGVFISESKKSVAICFQYNFMKKDLIDYIMMAKMIIMAFSFRNILKIMKHNDYISKVRPDNGNYLYFWFLGSAYDHIPGKGAREMATYIMRKASSDHLDIYAETTLSKNCRVYQRYGFEIYREWISPYSGIKVWFMRKTSSLESEFTYLNSLLRLTNQTHWCHKT